MKPISLLIFTLLPSTLFAGDYLISEEAMTMNVGMAFSKADSYWDNNSKLQQDNCTSSDKDLMLRMEYGYSYYYNFFGSVSFDKSTCGADSVSGIPDINLGIRGRVNPYRNHYAWELSLTIPIEGDRFDRSKPGLGAFGLTAAIYRSYVDDPYEKPFTEITSAIWGWGAGINLWTQSTGHQIWAQINWSHPITQNWRFKTQLRGTKAILAADKKINGVFESNKTVDYDELAISAKVGRGLGNDYSFGIFLQQSIWGRNAAKATSLQIELHKYWD